MPLLREAVQQTHRNLEASHIPDARLEAEVMLMNVMRMQRHDLFSQQETEVSPQQEEALAHILERRLQREPLAYILQYKEFYGVNLLVNPDVLIPRPETECMVEHALFMALMGMETPELVVADVGTGTGAIAINLAMHLPAARIFAVDCADAVLDVAAYNIRAHNVGDRVSLGKGDLLEPIPEPVDLILANLPYVPSDRIPNLQPEIRWEPQQALDGGPDGLDLIRRLLQQAPSKLKEHGIILLEVDPEQVPAVEAMAKEIFPEAELSVEKDLAQRDRIFVINRGMAYC